MTIAIQRSAAPQRLASLSTAVGADYIDRLQHLGSPLAIDDESKAASSLRARYIVDDVLRAFLNQRQPTSSVRDDPTRIPVPSGEQVQLSDELDGTALLFEAALSHLAREFPAQTSEIASTLLRRLLADLGETFERLSTDKPLGREAIDKDHARALLTNRQLAVFELVAQRVKTKAIATELNISELTVKRHISEIGKRLKVQGRPAILEKAREIGFLISVPITLSGALAAVNSLIAS